MSRSTDRSRLCLDLTEQFRRLCAAVAFVKVAGYVGILRVTQPAKDVRSKLVSKMALNTGWQCHGALTSMWVRPLPALIATCDHAPRSARPT